MHALLQSLPAETVAALAATRIEIDARAMAVLAAGSGARRQIEWLLGQTQIIAAIDDGHEVSFVVPESALAALDALAPDLRIERPFRFLRLDAVLPWTTVGYGAAIFAALAGAGVSAGMLSGFSTDYLLIPSASLSAALESLGRLFAQAAQT